MSKHSHIDLDRSEVPEPRYRYLGRVAPQDRKQVPLLLEDDDGDETAEGGSSANVSSDGSTAVIRLYDVIDSWGGFWGVSASEFIEALDSLDEGVQSIELHLNSPGGDAYEGITIYNALVDHPATVNVVVDGLAASAASVVAMAGDTIKMNPGTEMMIHDASTLAWGNPASLRDTAGKLDKLSNGVAAIYADQAGGKTSDWRSAMQDETWYSPKEAVDAGLATVVGKKSKKTDKAAQNKAKNQFDLSMFNYGGREQAPAPSLDTKIGKTAASLRVSSKQGQENHRVTPEQLEAIGLAEEATEDEINARLTELVANQAPVTDPAPAEGEGENGEGATPAEPEPAAPAPAPESAQNSFTPPKGTVLVDETQWAKVQDGLKTLDKMQADASAKERDDYIVAAMADGKFPPAARKHYEEAWDRNSANAKALIDSLQSNTVPVQPVGRGDDSAANQDDEPGYPEAWKSSLIPQQGARR